MRKRITACIGLLLVLCLALTPVYAGEEADAALDSVTLTGSQQAPEVKAGQTWLESWALEQTADAQGLTIRYLPPRRPEYRPAAGMGTDRQRLARSPNCRRRKPAGICPERGRNHLCGGAGPAPLAAVRRRRGDSGTGRRCRDSACAAQKAQDHGVIPFQREKAGRPAASVCCRASGFYCRVTKWPGRCCRVRPAAGSGGWEGGTSPERAREMVSCASGSCGR